MFALKLLRFSALGPMKYELMTWCGSVSLDGGDGILKIAVKMRIQPSVDITAASMLRQLSSPGEDLDIYHPSGIPSLQRHHRGAYRVQLKPPALISCMRRHGGEVALYPMHGNGERKTCLCSCVYFTAESYLSCWSWGRKWRLGSYTGTRRQSLCRCMMQNPRQCPS